MSHILGVFHSNPIERRGDNPIERRGDRVMAQSIRDYIGIGSKGKGGNGR